MRSSAIDAAAAPREFAGRDASDFFRLRLLDAHQRGVAQLVDAGLNGEQRGQRHFDVLEPAVFEFALDLDAAPRLLRPHDDGGVRQPQHFGEDDAGLAVAEIVGLQAGEDQVGLLGFERPSPSCGRAPRVSSEPGSSVSMWMARSAPLARASRMVCAARSGPGAERRPLRRRASPSAAGLLRARRRRAR